MTKLRQLNAAVILSLMLTASAFAGDIYIDRTPPPPDSSSAMVAGDIQLGGKIGVGGAETAGNSASGIALNLLQSLLSAF